MWPGNQFLPTLHLSSAHQHTYIVRIHDGGEVMIPVPGTSSFQQLENGREWHHFIWNEIDSSTACITEVSPTENAKPKEWIVWVSSALIDPRLLRSITSYTTVHNKTPSQSTIAATWAYLCLTKYAMPEKVVPKSSAMMSFSSASKTAGNEGRLSSLLKSSTSPCSESIGTRHGHM